MNAIEATTSMAIILENDHDNAYVYYVLISNGSEIY